MHYQSPQEDVKVHSSGNGKNIAAITVIQGIQYDSHSETDIGQNYGYCIQ